MKDSRIKLNCLIAVLIVCALPTLAQSEKFDEGKVAYLEGRHREALILLNEAVHNEKFLMKGKEIPQAYAYMAMIRNKHVTEKLKEGNIEVIKNNPGLLNSTVSDVTNALKFQDGSSKVLVNKAKNQLISNAMIIGQIVTDSLMNLDLDLQKSESKSLAVILNYELKNLSNVDNDNWELHDMIGISYYILDEQDLAMLEFKRSREIYNEQGATELPDLHLYNCIYSSKYNYKVSKNYIEAYNASQDGQKFVEKLIEESNSDSIHHIKKLVAIDGTFSSIQSRIENMNVLTSTKQ